MAPICAPLFYVRKRSACVALATAPLSEHITWDSEGDFLSAQVERRTHFRFFHRGSRGCQRGPPRPLSEHITGDSKGDFLSAQVERRTSLRCPGRISRDWRRALARPLFGGPKGPPPFLPLRPSLTFDSPESLGFFSLCHGQCSGLRICQAEARRLGRHFLDQKKVAKD